MFTGGTNYVGLFTPPLALGDSVMCYGRLDEFQGGGELRGLDPVSAFNNPLVAVRRISRGTRFRRSAAPRCTRLYELPTNLAAEQWEGCLVRVKRQDARRAQLARSGRHRHVQLDAGGRQHCCARTVRSARATASSSMAARCRSTR